MMFILTEEELGQERASLANELRDQSIIASAKSIVCDALHEAIRELPEAMARAIVIRADRIQKEMVAKLPEGSLTRTYFN